MHQYALFIMASLWDSLDGDGRTSNRRVWHSHALSLGLAIL